jgi:hypothetical protein
MRLVDELLRRPEIENSPPVLVDVGAAGALYPKWRAIAPYAVCIAFEGDPTHGVPGKSGFRELHGRADVVAERAGRGAFYLTRSPFCSSRLRPNERGVAPYALAPLFEVERIEEVQAVALPDVLSELGVARVDWFKTDSQGTDLRLFDSLGDDLLRRVLVVDLEPGIIDAYEGEDKLADVMSYMDRLSFWMSDLEIQGSPRIRHDVLDGLLPSRLRPYVDASLRAAPGWGEVEYFNDFEDESLFGKREYLVGCAFAWACGHHGFALELASRARLRFGDPVFSRVERDAGARIRRTLAVVPIAVARGVIRTLRARATG